MSSEMVSWPEHMKDKSRRLLTSWNNDDVFVNLDLSLFFLSSLLLVRIFKDDVLGLLSRLSFPD